MDSLDLNSKLYDSTTLAQVRAYCKDLSKNTDLPQLRQLAFESGIDKKTIQGLSKEQLCKKVATTLVVAPTININKNSSTEKALDALCTMVHNDVFVEETIKWARKHGMNNLEGLTKKQICERYLQPVNVVLPSSSQNVSHTFLPVTPINVPSSSQNVPHTFLPVTPINVPSSSQNVPHTFLPVTPSSQNVPHTFLPVTPINVPSSSQNVPHTFSPEYPPEYSNFRIKNGNVEMRVKNFGGSWKPFDKSKASFLTNPKTDHEKNLRDEYNKFVGTSQVISKNSYIIGGGVWDFTSDHRPLAMYVTIPHLGDILTYSWNVLNEIFKRGFIGSNGNPPTSKYGGGQQLAGTRLYNYDADSRRNENLDIIVKTMLEKNNAGLIALQEIDDDHLKDLKKRLPKKRYSLDVVTNAKVKHDHGVIIFDNSKFEMVGGKSSDIRSDKYIQIIVLKVKNTSFIFSVVNIHLPLGGRDFLGPYINKNINPPYIIMGDFNEDTQIPIYSHVNTKRQSVSYDIIDTLGLVNKGIDKSKMDEIVPFDKKF